MIVFAFCLTVLVWSAGGEEPWEKGVIDEDGILNIKRPGVSMFPYGGEYPVASSGYPSPAPNKLRQSWWYVSVPREGQTDNSVFKIICYDIRLPKESSCQETSLTVVDGVREHQYCSDVKPFTLLTDTDNIRIYLRVGPKGNAFVNCSAEAVHIDSNRQEMEKPKPTLPPYAMIDSEEVDSEEHGGAPGDVSTTCPCGWANKVSSRIVNGTVTAPNEFPFAIALVEKESLWQFCGGTIITSWHALTAAHCTIDAWRERVPLAIIVGEHNLKDDPNNGPSRVIDVQTIVEHQGYKPNNYRDDISLLILKEQIIFSSKVGPACLPTHQMDLTRQYLKVIGWGRLHWGGPSSDLLRKVDVRVTSRKECADVYGPVVSEKNPTHLCTFSMRKASCQGDSGGPVVWVDPDTNRYTLVGIVSFGIICADDNPSVDTDVGAYLDWIRHFVTVSKPDAHMCFKQE